MSVKNGKIEALLEEQKQIVQDRERFRQERIADAAMEDFTDEELCWLRAVVAQELAQLLRGGRGWEGTIGLEVLDAKLGRMTDGLPCASEEEKDAE